MKQLFYGMAILTVVATSGVAGAQYNQTKLDVKPAGVTFRGGAVLPVDNKLRDVSNLFIGLGAEYMFTHQFLSNSETYLSIDWFGKSSSGEKGNLFPVCLNQRFYTGSSRYGTGRSYYFVGAGVTFIDVGNSTDKLGVRGGVGTEIGPSVILEVAGYLSGKDSDGVSGTAVGAYIGYRFH